MCRAPHSIVGTPVDELGLGSLDVLLAGPHSSPQLSRTSLLWRAHWCVPRRHSWRRFRGVHSLSRNRLALGAVSPPELVCSTLDPVLVVRSADLSPTDTTVAATKRVAPLAFEHPHRAWFSADSTGLDYRVPQNIVAGSAVGKTTAHSQGGLTIVFACRGATCRALSSRASFRAVFVTIVCEHQ